MMVGEPPQDQAVSTNSFLKKWWESIWKHKPALAAFCLLTMAFVIASSIVLSLIPLYLAKKQLNNIDYNDNLFSLDLNYGTDLINGSSLTVTDLKTLADELSNEVHLAQIAINSATFVPQSTTNTNKKRREIGINNIPCQNNISTTGDWLVLSISIKYTGVCRTTNCKNAFIANIQKQIADVYYKINLNIKFTNNQTINLQLTLCSYEKTGTAQPTSQTTQSETTTTGSTSTTTTGSTATTTTGSTSTGSTSTTTTRSTRTGSSTTTTESTITTTQSTTTTSQSTISSTTSTSQSTTSSTTSTSQSTTSSTTTTSQSTTTSTTTTSQSTTSSTTTTSQSTTSSTTSTSQSTTSSTTTTSQSTTSSTTSTSQSTISSTTSTSQSTTSSTTTTSQSTTSSTTTTSQSTTSSTTTTSQSTISSTTSTSQSTTSSTTTTSQSTTSSTTTTSQSTTSSTTTTSQSTTSSTTSTSQPTTSSTTSTSQSTTSTTTQFTSQSIITQCQATMSTSSANQVESLQVTGQDTKVKMQSAPSAIGNRVLLKNAYLVEFASDSGVKDYFRTITNSLKTFHGIPESAIELRRIIRSSVFSGVSFSVTVNHSIEALEMIEDAIAIYPIYMIPAPQPIMNSIDVNVAYNNITDLVNSHSLTGVSQVHEEFSNFGKGVRVAVIDSGVYYLHPALGGCFGIGCKVEFGYDLVGDGYGVSNSPAVPDNDPLDNCSDVSHGTHVAGIIAANTTGINVTVFISGIPFIGVAPQVTLGAYRVFGCVGGTSTDIITDAIGRAYDDMADIINLSLGETDAYSELSDAIAVQRVIAQGVYVTVSIGNNGAGGLQTGLSPADALGAMSVGSVDSVGTLEYLGIPSATGGTPSSFTSLGLTGDLLIKPQISAIGGNVYSTLSLYATAENKAKTAYGLMSGTSMACPYTAGALALFLASIGNPAPNTTNGSATNGICRPAFSVATNIFQSSAIPVNIYNSSIFATVAQQGAGLVNVYQALTTTTLFSSSQLALNDTVRIATSYKVNVTNIGDSIAVYNISHVGGALATGATLTDDQLLPTPLYSADYANVAITPTSFQLVPGESYEITLQFQAPAAANSALFPIYSGFIYATNTMNGQVVHLSYAGVVGNYSDARILVRNTSSGIITGIQNATGQYVTSQQVSTLNATQGLNIVFVLAWSTRLVFIEAVSPGDNSQPRSGSNSSYGQLYNGYLFYFINQARNVAPSGLESYTQSSTYIWGGQVCPGFESCFTQQIYTLPVGRYEIRFSALKHFGNVSNPNDFEVYRTPPFNLTY